MVVRIFSKLFYISTLLISWTNWTAFFLKSTVSKSNKMVQNKTELIWLIQPLRVTVSSGRGLSLGCLGALASCASKRLKTALLALNTATVLSLFFSYFWYLSSAWGKISNLICTNCLNINTNNILYQYSVENGKNWYILLQKQILMRYSKLYQSLTAKIF